jgi:3-phenylpropionate/trans-cinnamate dioxygenase ferredoxin reductase subunit
VGFGAEPNIELAKAISLTMENGVIVNELLRTKEADIWPLGDVAVFYNPTLGNACVSSMKITRMRRVD